MKYRPKINSINDLQDGDEFLVGESRWVWEDSRLKSGGTVFKQSTSELLARDLIQANVPIERDIPCPEGYELKVGDGEWKIPKGAQIWCQGRWENWHPNAYAASSNIHIYATPIKPREFEGTVFNQMRAELSSVITIPEQLPVGTKVRVTVLGERE
jgi:hypothetical protein